MTDRQAQRKIAIEPQTIAWLNLREQKDLATGYIKQCNGNNVFISNMVTKYIISSSNDIYTYSFLYLYLYTYT